MADIEYKLIFELENGSTKECHIISPQGPIGETGPQGPKGDSPVKGVDYFTEEEQSEIVNEVLAALPTWTGGSY